MYRETLLKVLTALVYKKYTKSYNCNAKNQGSVMRSPTQNSIFALFSPISGKCSIFRCGDALQEDVERDFMYIANSNHYFV